MITLNLWELLEANCLLWWTSSQWSVNAHIIREFIARAILRSGFGICVLQLGEILLVWGCNVSQFVAFPVPAVTDEVSKSVTPPMTSAALSIAATASFVGFTPASFTLSSAFATSLANDPSLPESLEESSSSLE